MSQLPPLTVKGNKIVTADAETPILLRGVNRSGLEYSSPEPPGSLAKANITETEWDHIVNNWKANIIRIPFNQDWAWQRPGYDAEPYLTVLDTVIEMSARRGAYTVLDLQWLDAVHPKGRNANGTWNFVPSLPDFNSIQLWQQLAFRYRNEPAVLFDIFNEPHHPLPDDETELWGMNDNGIPFPLRSRRVSMREWQPWAVQLVRAIRSQHPDALILVPGIDWSYNLRGFPIRNLEHVVYSAHVYPNKGRQWTKNFGHLAKQAPVFIGEWGGGKEDLEWGRSLLTYMAERELNWTAWSWSDFPRLMESHQPTLFGQVVREALQATETNTPPSTLSTRLQIPGNI